jgi:hypothetical protein
MNAPELMEGNGQRIQTVWRLLTDSSKSLPPLCPSEIAEFLNRTCRTNSPAQEYKK